MGKCSVVYRELRFVIEDKLTQVFVLMDAVGDCPLGVQGWHHKAFPPSNPVQDILGEMFGNGDDCMLWPQKAP